jgi:hypothetical protein
LLGRVVEQPELVGIEPLTAGAVLPSEQLRDEVLQLLDPPPGLADGVGLLADQLVAGGQIVGEGSIDLAHNSIIGASSDC